MSLIIMTSKPIFYKTSTSVSYIVWTSKPMYKVGKTGMSVSSLVETSQPIK